MHAYLDNAATTPVAPEVVKAMMDVYTSVHGNPSSTHAPGRKAKALIEAGKIQEAVLCLEAEVQKNKDGAEAWRLLGLLYQEND